MKKENNDYFYIIYNYRINSIPLASCVFCINKHVKYYFHKTQILCILSFFNYSVGFYILMHLLSFALQCAYTRWRKLHLRKKKDLYRSFLREQKPLDIHTATQRPQTEAFLSFLTATQSKPETSTTIKRQFFCTHPNGENINTVIHIMSIKIHILIYFTTSQEKE